MLILSKCYCRCFNDRLIGDVNLPLPKGGLDKKRASNKKTKIMTNKPILKTEKMNINHLTTSNYANACLQAQKKNKPISNPKAKPMSS
jgi:hypothetical protein